MMSCILSKNFLLQWESRFSNVYIITLLFYLMGKRDKELDIEFRFPNLSHLLEKRQHMHIFLRILLTHRVSTHHIVLITNLSYFRYQRHAHFKIYLSDQKQETRKLRLRCFPYNHKKLL